jgi:hypothetical protein
MSRPLGTTGYKEDEQKNKFPAKGFHGSTSLSEDLIILSYFSQEKTSYFISIIERGELIKL